jgi:homoserine kinase
MSEWVSAFAPATVSNVACGFDTFGFAIDGPGDVVRAQKCSEKGVKITKISGDENRLPLDARKNTAGIAVNKLLKIAKFQGGVELQIEKLMPFASGLGSSAASAAAAVRAVNVLLGLKRSENELLSCIVESEKSISGTAHADNAAPSLIGGFVIVRKVKPIDILSVPVPDNLFYAIVHPRIEVNTSQARQAMPIIIPLKTAIQHWANTAALVHAMHSKDLKLLGRSMEDMIAEPVRKQWIPFYIEAKKEALANGAFACNISGSGPSIFAFCDSKLKAQNTAAKMKLVFDGQNIACSPFYGRIRQEGAVII